MRTHTYKEAWNKIKQNLDLYSCLNNQFNFNSIQEEDSFFKEVPLFQEYLTECNKTFYDRIEFSNYLQLPAQQMNTKNLYDCFHGILFYIYYYSENKLNLEEIEFHFSGAKLHGNLNDINTTNAINYNAQSNILNIFDYENIKSIFNINSVKYAFFGITFKRIKVNPIAYSIRSGIFQNNGNHLVSFTFEGYDEDNQKWDILDERVNINDLIPNGSFNMFFVHSTNKSYSSFKIKQIDPGSNGYWGFSIAAFDIHGIVSLRGDVYNTFDIESFEKQSTSFNFEEDYETFDPNMDMSDYIF